MGVGDAYLGIKQLLTSRDAKSKIPSILSFVAGSLRPIKSDIDPFLSNWYKAHSRIYVSPDHACWSDDESKKKVQRSRFGGVVRADIELGQGKGEVGRMIKRYALSPIYVSVLKFSAVSFNFLFFLGLEGLQV
jgi:histone deacetylase 6